MLTKLKHLLGFHMDCHPKDCQKAADLANEYDYLWRIYDMGPCNAYPHPGLPLCHRCIEYKKAEHALAMDQESGI